MPVILCILCPCYCQLRTVFRYTDEYAVHLLNYPLWGERELYQIHLKLKNEAFARRES